MTPTQKTRKRPSRGRSRGLEAIPTSYVTPEEERVAQRFDALVASATVRDLQIRKLAPEIVAAKVRGGASSLGKQFIDLTQVAGVNWPDTLYVPRDEQARNRPKPPDNRLYSHEIKEGTGVALASRDSGGLFAYASVATTNPSSRSDAGVGITYSPASTLSYVKYEPDVYCTMNYRMFVDFWPQLIAGGLRLSTSLITAAWLRSPVQAGSYELLRWNQVTVFDSFWQDAGSTVFPNIRHELQRNYLNSALSTTFQVQGGRTYVFGVLARASVWHNVTSNTGQTIPQDPKKFRLYAEMVCSVPFMAVSVQQVLIP